VDASIKAQAPPQAPPHKVLSRPLSVQHSLSKLEQNCSTTEGVWERPLQKSKENMDELHTGRGNNVQNTAQIDCTTGHSQNK
jgi:hypothetical protein